MKAESVFDIIQGLPENEYNRLLKMLGVEQIAERNKELTPKPMTDQEKRINHYKRKLGII